VSVCPGDLATIPAPQSPSAVLAECQRYYEKSFDVAVVPVQNLGFNTGEFVSLATLAGGGPVAGQVMGSIPYKVTKRITPLSVLIYNPRVGGTASQGANETTGADFTATVLGNNSENGFILTCTLPTTTLSDKLGVHWSSNSMLGY